MSTGRSVFDAVEVGDALTPSIHVPTRDQMVRYAGAAHDFSPIHFDDENARSRGFKQIIVHGLLKAAYLGDLLEAWSAPHGWVQKIRTEYRGVDLPDRPLVCRATVTDKSEKDGCGLVSLDLRIDNADGQETTRGTATVSFDLAEDRA